MLVPQFIMSIINSAVTWMLHFYYFQYVTLHHLTIYHRSKDDDVFYPPPLRLEWRKPLWRDLQSIDVTCRWREDWQSATVVNSTLVVDPTIRLPSFDLHRRQWSLLNCFRTGQAHCSATRNFHRQRTM